jgi:hypothetical protein
VARKYLIIIKEKMILYSNLPLAIVEACADVEKWAYTIDAIFLHPVECAKLRMEFNLFEPMSALLYMNFYYSASCVGLGSFCGRTIVSFSKITPGYIFILKKEDMLGFCSYNFDVNRCIPLNLEKYDVADNDGAGLDLL